MQTRWPVLLLAQELGQGGSERQLTEIAKALDRQRFDVHVGCLRPTGFRIAELRAAGIPVTCFPVESFSRPGVLRAARQYGEYLRRNSIRLVHSFDAPGNLFSVPAAKVYRTPVVLSSQRAYRQLAGKALHHLLRLTDLLVDGVVVNCRAIERHLIADEKVAPGRIHLCFNGIDTSEFHPGDAAARDDAGSITIGVVCALRPEKGLETLVEAFAAVARVHTHARLLLVGSGPMKVLLEARLRELGLDERCHFEPSTPKVAEWLRRMDIFVLPSLSEALSNSLMEAMACGRAVIASNVGGNPELVSPGETGLLFEPGDAAGLASQLNALVEQPVLRRELAEAAHRRIHTQFTLAHAAQRMGEIYARFL